MFELETETQYIRVIDDADSESDAEQVLWVSNLNRFTMIYLMFMNAYIYNVCYLRMLGSIIPVSHFFIYVCVM